LGGITHKLGWVDIRSVGRGHRLVDRGVGGHRRVGRILRRVGGHRQRSNVTATRCRSCLSQRRIRTEASRRARRRRQRRDRWGSA
jgi:hypothetical protein